MHVLLNFLEKSLFIGWQSFWAKLELLLQKSVVIGKHVKTVDIFGKNIRSKVPLTNLGDMCGLLVDMNAPF